LLAPSALPRCAVSAWQLQTRGPLSRRSQQEVWHVIWHVILR
jgi:hypothetical protein